MMPEGPLDVAVAQAVDHLVDVAGGGAALFARCDGLDLVVTHVAGDEPPVGAGAELRWPEGADEIFVAGHDRPVDAGAHAVAPVRLDSGETIGLLAVFGGTLEGARGSLATLAALLGRIAQLDADLAAEHARTARAEAEALFDPLTGLGNRRYWTRLVEVEDSRCRRHGEAAAVIIADLDRFKEVNDELGHAAGDDLLRRAAGVLRRISREHDAAARLGGDEFGLLAVGCGHDAAEALARRLQTALADDGIEASVGFAGRHPAGGLTHAWRRADTAMYADKRRRGASRPTVDLAALETGRGTA